MVRSLKLNHSEYEALESLLLARLGRRTELLDKKFYTDFRQPGMVAMHLDEMNSIHLQDLHPRLVQLVPQKEPARMGDLLGSSSIWVVGSDVNSTLEHVHLVRKERTFFVERRLRRQTITDFAKSDRDYSTFLGVESVVWQEAERIYQHLLAVSREREFMQPTSKNVTEQKTIDPGIRRFVDTLINLECFADGEEQEVFGIYPSSGNNYFFSVDDLDEKEFNILRSCLIFHPDGSKKISQKDGGSYYFYNLTAGFSQDQRRRVLEPVFDLISNKALNDEDKSAILKFSPEEFELVVGLEKHASYQIVYCYLAHLRDIGKENILETTYQMFCQ